jgi:SAM-dependent methyltransferase
MSSRSLIQFDNTKDLGAWYDQKYQEMGGGWSMMEQTATEIFDFIGNEAPLDRGILDVGCGGGHFAHHAKKYAQEVLGIDCSKFIIEKAKQDFPEIFFRCADIETHEFTGGFGLITSVGSVEHCINVNKALNNIRKHLVPGGVFYALVPNELWIHMDQPQEQTHTDDEWTDIFSQAQFRVIKHRRDGDLSQFLLKPYEN